MKLWNICTKKTYEKNGEEKAIWLRVGTLKETDQDKKFIELNMFPKESFYVFENKPKANMTSKDEVWDD